MQFFKIKYRHINLGMHVFLQMYILVYFITDIYWNKIFLIMKKNSIIIK